MFNFLASQHRELPDFTGPFEEEDDEFPLKSSRQDRKSAILIPIPPQRGGSYWVLLKTLVYHTRAHAAFLCFAVTDAPPAASFPWR